LKYCKWENITGSRKKMLSDRHAMVYDSECMKENKRGWQKEMINTEITM
jgi:hypothetical protein